MLESMKPYLDLAAGLTEVTATKAAGLAQGLLAQGSASMPGKPSLSDLGMEPQAAEALLGAVREEVDKVAHRLGFVREDELIALRRQVERLENDLAQAREDAAAASMLAAAEQAGTPSGAGGSEALADTVLASARRVIDIAGALDAVSAIPGGPWARVARDVASSAASLVQSAGGGAVASTSPAPATATVPSTPSPAQTPPDGPAADEKPKKAKGKGAKSNSAKHKKGPAA